MGQKRNRKCLEVDMWSVGACSELPKPLSNRSLSSDDFEKSMVGVSVPRSWEA